MASAASGTGSEPVRSLWLREAMAGGFEPMPPLVGDHRTDVCVVGGGYTGLWTAIRLKEDDPSIDVSIVERDVCGGGASGRNGGFVLTWWSKFISLAKLCGYPEALRLAAASSEAVEAIGSFCAAHGIDAHFRGDGWLWAATNRAQLDGWGPTLDAVAAHGAEPFVELTPDEAGRRSGSPVHLGGVLEPVSATVQPALLALGLRRVAMDRGVRVFEGTPVTGIRPGVSHRVATASGTVTADRVVLAMNAWGVRFTEIRRAIFVVGSDIVSTPPIPDRLERIGWTDGLCISDGRLLVHYYRTTRDGRIVFGKGGGEVAYGSAVGARFEGASPRRREAEEGFRFLYPMLLDVPIEAGWTGPIDRSRTGLPFFGFLGRRRDIVFGAGYSGNGVGPSYVGGRILASMAQGLDDEWAGAGLVGRRAAGFPPEPIRYIGALAVRAAIRRKERADDAGRAPSPLARALVRLAPSGLVPNKRG